MPTEATASSSENLLREKIIDDARDGWKNRLIDLSRRNNLLFYKPLVSGTLELPVTPRVTEFLKSGEALPISDLLENHEIKVSNVQAIARKGLENLEEKGLSTLYLVVGKCSWTADDGGRDPVAPVLLVPIGLKLKGQDIRSTEIEINGEFEINPVLLHILNRELNVSIDAETLLCKLSPAQYSDVSGEDETAREVNIASVLDCLTAKAIKVPGFRAEPFAVIGNFSFQKLAMVKDLENRRSELHSNDVVAAIAGDTTARRNLGASHIEIDPANLDTILPDNEFAVVEADSSQQCAIVGIAAGQSAVVHGPPGTGKSQTITNLIATLTASGKKILFVAEKRAALEVVMNRLTAVGLDHLAIDLHGAEQAPKKVMERVARTLGTIREAGIPVAEAIHSQFVDRRDKLNQHDSKMHKTHAPTGQTLYAMQGALLRLPSGASSPLRWRGPDLLGITAERSKRILDLLREAAGFETLFNRTDPSPWCGIEFHDGQAAQNAIDLANRLTFEEIPALTESLNRICDYSGLLLPKTMAGATELLKAIAQANRILDLYQPDIFTESAFLLQALSAGWIGGVKGMWVRLTSDSYKTALKRAIAIRGDVKANGSTVFAELTEAAAILVRWQQLSVSGALPRTVSEAANFDQIYQRAHRDLHALETICKWSWHESEFPDVLARVSALASDNTTPYRIRLLCDMERELSSHGVQRLVDEIRSSRKPSAIWCPLFQHAWLKSTLDLAAISDPSVRAFVGATHNAYVDDFKRLDSTRLELAAKRVRRAHAERTIAAMNQFPEQESLIRAEAAKTRRHKPLRKTFAEAKDVLTAVCPCWMASPLSVCQLISATGIFDYVIFDEASQVLPEDAIPAILRAYRAMQNVTRGEAVETHKM